jgi:hypothetical protein
MFSHSAGPPSMRGHSPIQQYMHRMLETRLPADGTFTLFQLPADGTFTLFHVSERALGIAPIFVLKDRGCVVSGRNCAEI